MKIPIRNFSIIAHIDHGKSTLADRLLEMTGTLNKLQMKEQVLDDMDLERERGITIKSHPIRLQHKARDGHKYILNLIDTPGHVDFSYEVSRSLAACEGALLLVDASQGIEAQTISNTFLALDNNLEIIPVINKIDLPGAQVDAAKEQIIDLLGCEESDILLTSAKTGLGVDELLEAIVRRIPAPRIQDELPARALIFDSVFDSYRGAIPYVRVMEGELRAGKKLRSFATRNEYEITEVGHFHLKRVRADVLSSGDVGYIVAQIKNIKDLRVGDTITTVDNPAKSPLAGYKEMKSMVFSGIYPVINDDYEELRQALEKLQLNDAALHFEPETSDALGFGFRCGFLGMLHLEIVQERLEREFGQSIVSTVPNVEFHAFLRNGTMIRVDTPAKMPQGDIDRIEEPFVKAEIITPAEYIGAMMKLTQDKRGIYRNTHYLDKNKVQLMYEIPLSEIVFDFYDRLKTVSRGYASLDYEFIGYRPADLVKLDILINGEPVDALSLITHRDDATYQGRELVVKLRSLIPRHQFEVPIQAAVGAKILARENVKALRKNVTAKCYGGDITRKRKLLERQKEGKKRMKQVGAVQVPQEAFFAVLQIDKSKKN
ncbi:MAG: translation elongation factor 4 [Candidatus Marinimicrobia bacterium]|nr:translation elongation factor 4 [Candidatus Neomarinimicrobiota bacterium]MDD4961578.1 translation elongation factor 4 [Candidatus Neomarinimicrobiota bacterium]MDD5709159.1 translation elongation factor 4 [Candidatus Neomarinimicrobiota bacterium]